MNEPEGAEWAEMAAAAAPDTPALVVDLDVVQRNIDRAARAARMAGVALRPHTKTHKLPELARMQVAAGADGIQVAKVGEAEVMADAGLTDILIGYPVVGASKLDRVVALARRSRITVSLDSMAVARPLSEHATASGATVDVLVEIDTGLSRVGVGDTASAIELAQELEDLPSLQFRGLLTHEGHVYSVPGPPQRRSEIANKAYDFIGTAAAALRSIGLPATVVSVGSSATFALALTRADVVTEVRPGTYVFNDRTQVALGVARPSDVAAAVVATVVSKRRSGEFIIDAGSKALSSDRMLVADPPNSFGKLIGRDSEVVRLSEEHAVVSASSGDDPRIGDRVAVMPNHICPVVNLFEAAAVCRSGSFVAEWRVAARGKLT